jgi:hypothetical protein
MIYDEDNDDDDDEGMEAWLGFSLEIRLWFEAVLSRPVHLPRRAGARA